MADRLLAFDTSTDRLSIAVRHGERTVAHDGPGGAQASATLIPLIRGLLAEAGLSLGALDAIVFGRGPGSFTGLRTACAVGLGFGAGVPLLPVDTLHALAEEARHRFGTPRVVAVLDARMDQVYAARVAFDGDAASVSETEVMAPEAVVVPEGWVLAGNAFAAYGDRLPAAVGRHEVLPTAGALLRLAPALLAAGRAVDPADAWPLYVRDKVAQTTDERAAIKAASAASLPVAVQGSTLR
jgi:tRNA threonylcarbamoyladenosine biosynthesis protein TsaB